MPNGTLDSLKELSDADLVARTRSLAALERGSAAELVAHLAELLHRELHLREGYGSLFVYCREALLFSEHDAYNRVEAARAVRRFPLILELLALGSLNLTTVRLLARHLTPENHEQVLASAAGKRKTEVEELVASLAPWPDVPPSIRKLPPPRPAAVGASPAAGSPPSTPAPATTDAALRPPARPAPLAVTPLAPERYKVQITVGADTLEKLRLAKDMLRHAIPSGDDAAVFDRALTALLTDLARKKFSATDHPRPTAATPSFSRHIPAEVRRAVWLRDLGRCAFVGDGGRRCGERAFVEFHHLLPYAAGGPATVDNIQLRCRRHNGYEARIDFGLDERARSGAS
jgi:hypothetical protein